MIAPMGQAPTIQERIESLKQQHARGRAVLADLDVQREEVRAGCLRIEGAIEALSALLAAKAEPEPAKAEPVA